VLAWGLIFGQMQPVRPAGRAQHLMHDERYHGGLSLTRGMAPPAQPFLAALSALAIQTGRAAAGALALQETGPHGREHRHGPFVRLCYGAPAHAIGLYDIDGSFQSSSLVQGVAVTC
jgi:hypothetical protein